MVSNRKDRQKIRASWCWLWQHGCHAIRIKRDGIFLEHELMMPMVDDSQSPSKIAIEAEFSHSWGHIQPHTDLLNADPRKQSWVDRLPAFMNPKKTFSDILTEEQPYYVRQFADLDFAAAYAQDTIIQHGIWWNFLRLKRFLQKDLKIKK